jgi:hypothetical protein
VLLRESRLSQGVVGALVAGGCAASRVRRVPTKRRLLVVMLSSLGHVAPSGRSACPSPREEQKILHVPSSYQEGQRSTRGKRKGPSATSRGWRQGQRLFDMYTSGREGCRIQIKNVTLSSGPLALPTTLHRQSNTPWSLEASIINTRLINPTQSSPNTHVSQAPHRVPSSVETELCNDIHPPLQPPSSFISEARHCAGRGGTRWGKRIRTHNRE